jgi:hypothetical protein
MHVVVGTAYPSEAPEFTPAFFRVTRSLVLYVCFVDRPFVLFLLAIVLSVLRYTDSDYPFVPSNSSKHC